MFAGDIPRYMGIGCQFGHRSIWEIPPPDTGYAVSLETCSGVLQAQPADHWSAQRAQQPLHPLKRQLAQKERMRYTNVLPVYPDGASSPIGYIPLDLYENSTTLQANANFNRGRIILSGGELVQVKWVYKYIDNFPDRVEMKAIESRNLHKLTQLRELISFRGVTVPPHKWDVITRYDPVWREMAQQSFIVLLASLQSHMQALFGVDVDSSRRFLDVHAPCSLSHFRIVGEHLFEKRRSSNLVPHSMENVIRSYNTVAEVGHPQFAIYYDDGAMTEPERMRQLMTRSRGGPGHGTLR